MGILFVTMLVVGSVIKMLKTRFPELEIYDKNWPLNFWLERFDIFSWFNNCTSIQVYLHLCVCVCIGDLIYLEFNEPLNAMGVISFSFFSTEISFFHVHFLQDCLCYSWGSPGMDRSIWSCQATGMRKYLEGCIYNVNVAFVIGVSTSYNPSLIQIEILFLGRGLDWSSYYKIKNFQTYRSSLYVKNMGVALLAKRIEMLWNYINIYHKLYLFLIYWIYSLQAEYELSRGSSARDKLNMEAEYAFFLPPEMHPY